jgi:hypothetical protein
MINSDSRIEVAKLAASVNDFWPPQLIVFVLVVVVRYIFNKSFGEEGNLAQKPTHAMLLSNLVMID